MWGQGLWTFWDVVETIGVAAIGGFFAGVGMMIFRFFDEQARIFVRWVAHLLKPPTPDFPLIRLEFDSMAKFRAFVNVKPARDDERNPAFGIVGRQLNYAVNDGDVSTLTQTGFDGGELAIENLQPGQSLALQLFNVDSTGRLSEPAEVVITIPTPTEPPVLPTPDEPTIRFEQTEA